jgi:RHS repeat-associated protein
LDASALSSKTILVVGNSFSQMVDASAPTTIQLAPGSYYVQPGSGVVSFSFVVNDNGLVGYDSAVAPFLSGAGTQRLVMRGFSTTVDSSALSQKGFIIQSLFGLGKILDSGTPLTLLPGKYYFQVGAGQLASFTWVLGQDGTISYPPEFAGFLSGQGTSTLVVRGYRVRLDAAHVGAACQGPGASSRFNVFIFGTDTFDKSVVHELTLVPSRYSYYDYHDGSGAPTTWFYWNVALDGSISLDPELGPCVEGAGTPTLKVMCDPHAPSPANQVSACPCSADLRAACTTANVFYAANIDPTLADGYVTQPGTQVWMRQVAAMGTPAVARGVMDGTTPAWELRTLGDMAHEETWIQTPSLADVAAANERGWTLITTLRMLTENDALDPGVAVDYTDGTTSWQMQFGTDGNAAPVVGVAGDPRTFTVGGGAGAYHTYALRFDPSTRSAVLTVDGGVALSDLRGAPLAGRRVAFGDLALIGSGDARFRTVEWSIAGSASGEGAPCDDGNACTDNDVVRDGVCLGAPKICTAASSCRPMACDPTSGRCEPNAGVSAAACTDDSCDPGLPGLISLWSAENNALDSIGRRDGTRDPTAPYSGGRFGSSFRLWQESYQPTFPIGVPLPSYSIEFWFQSGLELDASNGIVLLAKSGQYVVGVSGGALFTRLGPAAAPTGTLRGTPHVWPAYQWNHVAVTYDAATTAIALYLNGHRDALGTSPVSLLDDAGDLMLSAGLHVIDEVALYSRALSDTEVVARASAPVRICARSSCEGMAEGAPCDEGDICTYSDSCRSGVCSGFRSLSCEQERRPQIARAPADSVEAWWSAENTATDGIGPHHGTLSAGAGYIAGKRGSAFHFLDGGWFTVTSPTISLDRFTVQFWLKPDVTIDATDPVSKTLVDKPLGGAIGMANSNGQIEIGEATPRAYSTTNRWPADTWSHVAVTYDGVVYGVYVNGILEGWTRSMPSILRENGQGFRLGRRFTGAMDEIGVYRRALTSTEIKAIFDAGGAFAPIPIEVTVTNAAGAPQAARAVSPYQDTTVMGAAVKTDAAGKAVVFVLPGSYHFGATDGSTVRYSTTGDDCAVTSGDGCRSATIVFPGNDPSACAGAPAGTDCDDSDACTNGETCDGAGHCAGGSPLTCVGDDPCTNPTCDRVLGCKLEPAPEGTSCNEGDACARGVCRAGACVPSDPAPTCALQPLLTCVRPNPLGGFTAVFDYKNSSASNVYVLAGSDSNKVDGLGDQLQPQPSWFAAASAGDNALRAPFMVDFTDNVRWKLGNTTVTVTGANTCDTTSCGPDQVRVRDRCWDLPLTQERATKDTIVATETPIDGNTAAGKLNGTFSVTHDGAASYEIPIWVPPGRAGMTPRLALKYGSRTGNGELGVGWSLTGDSVSMITRCKRTVSQDGRAEAVAFKDSDALCLDGKRLVAIRGDYGSRNAEYRTEEDEFAKIVPVDGGFEIRTKDGRILTYGGPGATFDGDRTPRPTDEIVGIPGPEPRSNVQVLRETFAWALARIRDRSGNAIRVTYHNDSALKNPTPPRLFESDPNAYGNEFVLQRISYGLDGGGTIEKSVEFVYDPPISPLPPSVFAPGAISRPDPSERFVSGFEISTRRRLAEIRIKARASDSPQTLRTYRLTYSTDLEETANGLSLLKSVAECDGAGLCKKPTTFDYTSSQIRFEPVDIGEITDVREPGGDRYLVLRAADVDGDGRDDLLYRRAATFAEFAGTADWWYRPSTGEGFGPPQELGIVGPIAEHYLEPRMVDVDMDGRVDMIAPLPPLVTSNGQQVGIRWTPIFSRDIDGKTVFVPGEDDRFRNAIAVSPDVLIGTPNVCSGTPLHYYPLIAGDLTGDGMPDVLRPLDPLPSNGSPYPVWGARLNVGGSLASYRELLPIPAPDPINGLTAFSSSMVGAFYLIDVDGAGKQSLLQLDFNEDFNPNHDPFVSRFAMHSHTTVGIDHGDRATLDTDAPLATANDSKKNLQVPFGNLKPAGPLVDLTVMDVNGDGLQDIVANGHCSIPPTVAINVGGDFAPPYSLPDFGPRFQVGQVDLNCAKPRSGIDNGLRITDVDQDGREDLVMMDTDAYEQRFASPADRRTAVSFVLNRPNRNHQAVASSPPIPIGDVVKDPQTFTWFEKFLLSSQGQTCQLYPKPPIGYKQSQLIDVNGDGLADLVFVRNGRLELWVHRGKANMLRKVTDGYGSSIDVVYKPATDPTVHTPVKCAAPQHCTGRGVWLVSEHDSDTGVDGSPPNRFTHTYVGAATDIEGRGWLGVKEHKIVEEDRNRTTTLAFANTDFGSLVGGSLYPRAYPLLGKPISETTETAVAPGRLLVKTRATEYAVFARSAHSFTAMPSRISEKLEDLGSPSPSGVVSHAVTELEYDDFGNVTRDESVTADREIDRNEPFAAVVGERSLTRATYDNDDGEWLIGLRRTSRVTSTTSSGKAATRSFAFSYEPGTHLVHEETIEPKPKDDLPRDPLGGGIGGGSGGSGGVDLGGGEPLELTRIYERYPNGLVRRVTEAPAGEFRVSRVTETVYDTASQTFPLQVRNPEGHLEKTFYEPLRGVLAAVEDSNGAHVTYQYDGFDRRRTELPADGARVGTSYQAAGALLVVRTERAAGGLRTVTHDRLERAVREERTTFAGGLAVETKTYDPLLGLLVGQTTPADSDTPAVSKTWLYDSAGRLLEHHYGPRKTSYRYAGREVEITEPASDHRVVDGGNVAFVNIKTIERDVLDRAQRIVERDGSASPISTRLGYGPFGLLEDVTDTKGNLTHIEYDRRGRRTSMNDPNSGVTTYVVDAFGDVSRETDSNGLARVYTHDRLGRVTKEETDGRVATQSWDTAAHGIGKLGSATSLDGLTTTFDYDMIGRVSKRTLLVAERSYAIGFDYDSVGRLGVLQYPSPDGVSQFAVGHEYATSGELRSLRNANTQVEYWRAEARNARSQIRHEVFGDRVSSQPQYDPATGLPQTIDLTDGTGVLRSYAYGYYPSLLLRTRTETTSGISEAFEYDGLDRLRNWKASGAASWSVTYAYDQLGNLTGRTYEPSAGAAEELTYEYSGVNAGPHAVTNSPWGGYTYDNRGNRTGTPDGTVAYTPFSLPREVRDASGSVRTSFQYDADHVRTVKDEVALGKKTVYAGGIYEHRTAGNLDSHVFYVVADGRAVAQVAWTGPALTEDITYLHDDHLGTVDAVTTNETNRIVLGGPRRLDPFGNEVSLSAPALIGARSSPLKDVHLGFTKQEEDFELGLVNMRGRMYEPRTGRFLTPDPIAQTSGGQGLNRYAYVRNNPVNGIDPSGLCPLPMCMEPDPPMSLPDEVNRTSTSSDGPPTPGGFSTDADHEGRSGAREETPAGHHEGVRQIFDGGHSEESEEHSGTGEKVKKVAETVHHAGVGVEMSEKAGVTSKVVKGLAAVSHPEDRAGVKMFGKELEHATPGMATLGMLAGVAAGLVDVHSGLTSDDPIEGMLLIVDGLTDVAGAIAGKAGGPTGVVFGEVLIPTVIHKAVDAERETYHGLKGFGTFVHDMSTSSARPFFWSQ